MRTLCAIRGSGSQCVGLATPGAHDGEAHDDGQEASTLRRSGLLVFVASERDGGPLRPADRRRIWLPRGFAQRRQDLADARGRCEGHHPRCSSSPGTSLEQPSGKLAPADEGARTSNATIQIDAARPAIPRRARADLESLPTGATPTAGLELSNLGDGAVCIVDCDRRRAEFSGNLCVDDRGGTGCELR